MMTPTRCGRIGLLTLLLSAAGCALDRPYPSKTFYVLPAIELSDAATSTPPVALHVPRARVAPPFNVRALQYRTGPATYEPTYYDQWSSDIGGLLSETVSRSIAQQGAFVILPETAGAPAPTLRLQVTDLYAEVRDAQNPRAVLTVEATLLYARGGIILTRTLHAETAAASSEPADIINAWSAGLGRELDELLPAMIAALHADQAESNPRKPGAPTAAP